MVIHSLTRSWFYKIVAVVLCVALTASMIPPVGWGLLFGVGVAHAAPAQVLLPEPADRLDEASAIAPDKQPRGVLLDMSAQPKTPRQPAALADPLSVSRVQSVYRAADAISGTLVITFTVTNNQLPAASPSVPVSATITETVAAISAMDYAGDPHTIHNVLLADSLTERAAFVSSSPEPERAAPQYAWNLGDVPPLSSVTATLVVSVPTSATSFITLDTGAAAWGTLQGRAVSAQARPAGLAPDSIDGEPSGDWLKWTVDADKYDEYMLASAAELGQDPLRLFEYVRSLGYESYKGSLRGTRGTLWSKAGNSMDKSSLLIAMLRASGIPSRYRHGTLSTENAQTLILSMFPKPQGVVGHIPASAVVVDPDRDPLESLKNVQTADPANDPQLLAETQDHWWVEAYLPGSGWTDLDPSFASAQPGQTFHASLIGGTDRIAEVPDALRHKVTISLQVENYHPLNIGQSGLVRSYPLRHTFNSVELVGEPVSLGHLIQTESMGGFVFWHVLHTYIPYLAVGDLETAIEGTSFLELFSNFPLGQFLITGEWLLFELRDPDGNTETFTRELADRIGFDARASGGHVNISVSEAPPPPIARETDVYVTHFAMSDTDPQSGLRQIAPMLDLAQEMAALRGPLQQAQGSGSAEAQALAHAAARLYQRYARRMLTMAGVMYAAKSDAFGRLTQQQMLVRAYPASPRILVCSASALMDSQTIGFSTDLIKNTVRAIAYPGQTTDATVIYLAQRGNAESVLEGQALAQATGRAVHSSIDIYNAAIIQGIETGVISISTLDDLRDFDISSQAKSRIQDAVVNHGRVAIVPRHMVEFEGEWTIAWLEVDSTGNTIAVRENGLHNAFTDYIADLNAGALTDDLVAFLIGMMVGELMEFNDFMFAIFSTPELWSGELTPLEYKELVFETLVSSSISAITADFQMLAGLMPERALLDLALTIIISLVNTISSQLLAYLVTDMPVQEKLDLVALFVEVIKGVIKDIILWAVQKAVEKLAGLPKPNWEAFVMGMLIGKILMIYAEYVAFFMIALADPGLAPMRYSPVQASEPAPSRAQRRVAAGSAYGGGPIQARVRAAHLYKAGTFQTDWSGTHSILRIGALQADPVRVYDNNGALVGQGAVAVRAREARGAVAMVQGEGVAYSAAGEGESATYAPPLAGLGVGNDWVYTGTLSSAQVYTIAVQNVELTLGGETRLGNYFIVADAVATTLAGAGHTAAPTFAAAVSIQASGIDLGVGPAVVLAGSLPFDAANGFALAGYTGAITVTEASSTLDQIELNGAFVQALTLKVNPATSVIAPIASTVFEAIMSSNLADVYTVTVEGPEGWTVEIGAGGVVSATPPLGTAPGDYAILVTAQSAAHPGLFASAVHTVTTTPYSDMQLDVAPDSLTYVPWGNRPAPFPGAPSVGNLVNLPGAAYNVYITNTSTISHTFHFSVSPSFPADWLILSGDEITLPAGGASWVGLYVSPTLTTLPPPGAGYAFTVRATAVDDPALTRQDSELFTVPALAFNYLAARPAMLYASPNTSATFDLGLHNVGNFTGTFGLAVTLPISTWQASLASPSVEMAPGQGFTQPVTLSIRDASIGRSYLVRVDSPTSGAAYTQTTYVNVDVVGPNVLSIYQAAQAAAQLFPEDISLQTTLQYLGTAMEELEETCAGATALAGPGQAACSTDLRDHVVSGALAVVNHSGSLSPLITADETMQPIAQALQSHTDWVDVSSDLDALREAVVELQAQMQDVAHYGARAWFAPGLRAVLDRRPAAFNLNLTNQGSLAATYLVTLTASPALTITGPFTFVQALAPGASVSIPVTATPPELGLYTLQAQVAALEATHIAPLRSQAGIKALEALLQLTSVRAQPAFVEYGSGVAPAISAHIANVANLPMEGSARVRVLDSGGTSVRAYTVPVQIAGTLAPAAYPLGTVSTSGLATGTYTVTVSIVDEYGLVIPKASGYGLLAVGQAVKAASGVSPALVTPGNVTVTTIITTQLNEAVLLPWSALPQRLMGLASLRAFKSRLASSAVSLELSGVPTQTAAGNPFTVTVTARDGVSNPATDYTGTVELSSSDQRASIGNLALGRPASTNAGGSGIANITDGNPVTEWAKQANMALGDYVQVDLGSSQTINRVILDSSQVVNHNIDYARGFKVLISPSGVFGGEEIVAWQRDGDTAQRQVANFAPVTGRYVRVVLTAIASGYWWRVGELEVYGPQYRYTFTSGTGLDNGVHRFRSVSMGLAGAQTLTVVDVSNPALTHTLGTSVTPAALDASASHLSVSSPHRADGVETATITVTATDGFGNNVPGQTVWIVASGSGNVITGSPGTTGANGVFTATLASTRAEAKQVRALAGAGQALVWLPDSPLVEFTGASIAGAVFSDPNRNGAREGGEPGLGGVQVSLYQAASTQPLKRTVTADDGSYAFTGLEAGTYRVVQTRLDQYAFSALGVLTVTLGSFAASTGNDLGNYAAAQVSGYAWNDGNQDKTRQADEPGLAGVAIRAYDVGNLLVTSDTTSLSGTYHLDLAAGLPAAPDNFTFNSGQLILQEPAVAVIGNGDFGRGQTALPATTYPANYDFANTNLAASGWTSSSATYVQVISDAYNLDGSYLRLNAYNQSATSPALVVPAEAHSLRFNYFNWTTRDSAEQARLLVEVLSGADFSVSTLIGDLWGSHNEGWKTAALNLLAFRGQTIKLRFRTHNDWSRNDRSRLDNLSLQIEAPDWTLSNAAYVHVISDAYNLDGAYLQIGAYNQSATSPALVVPNEAHSLRFNYWSWTDRSTTEQARLFVDVLGGVDFSASTLIGDLWGSANEGWKAAVLDLQAFRGQTIKLRFRTCNDWGRNDKSRLDNLRLNAETPGWTPSAVGLVSIGDSAPPDNPGATTPQNPDLSAGLSPLPTTTYPANYDLTQGRTALPTTTYPANYDFANASLAASGWTSSSATYVQVISDAYSLDGSYLRLNAYNQSATSPALVVPAEAHSLRFNYFNWTTRDSTEQARLLVEVLSGADFSVSTLIGDLWGSHNEGWKTAALNLLAFRGQTIKLRFRTHNDWSRNDRSRLDNLSLQIEAPDWTLSNAAYVQVISDAYNLDGAYLQIGAYNQSATSSAFVVPAEAHSLRFNYSNWTDRNSAEQARLFVDVLGGPAFGVSTLIGDLWGSANEGWKAAVLDLQAYRGQTIKLRFRTCDDWSRNDKSRLDNLSLNVETPGWTPSNASLVSIRDAAPPDNPGATAPQNPDLSAGLLALPTMTYPANYDLAQGRTALPTTTYPANYDFANASLAASGWTSSSATYVQVISDAYNLDGSYLRLNAYNQSATSPALVVPAEAHSLRFNYFNWTTRDSAEQARLLVEVLSGADFSVSTLIGDLWGSHNEGWKTAALDLQAFRGQTVKLRFRTHNDWSRNDRSRLDNLSLQVEAPGWTLSNAAYVQVISDAYNLDGAYLRLNAYNQSATSSAFVVPAEAQSLHFNYSNWTDRSSSEQARLFVDVLSGPTFGASTLVGDLWGSANEGWKAAVLDLQAYRGQTIKLRFRTCDDWSRNDRSRLDNLSLNVETPGWTPSNASLASIQSSGGISGTYLHLGRYDVSATSTAFYVPTTTESLNFDYLNWTDRDSGEQTRLFVYVLSGVDFGTSTQIGDLYGSAAQGWQQASLGLAAFRGRTIKLRFRTEWWDSGQNGQAKIDNVTLVAGAGGPPAGSYANPGGAYLYLGRYDASATSTAFYVPTNTDSLHFDYLAWTDRNDAEQTRLFVYVLSGVDFGTSTQIGDLYGSAAQGWQQASLGLAAFRGRTIKLRFHTEWWDSSQNGQSKIDNVTLVAGAGGPPAGSYANPGGAYLYLGRYDVSATSAAFWVPTGTQSVRFDYNNWTDRDSTEQARLFVYVLSGADFGTSTQIGDLYGSANQGWKQATLNITAFQSQTIKLRFRTEWWDSGQNGKSRIDNIYLLPLATTPYTVTEINLPNYTSTTSDSVGLNAYGGAAFTIHFGDYAVDRYKSTLQVAPTTLAADGAQAAVVTVTLRDGGNNPIAGRAVQILATGAALTITQPLNPTDAQGQATGALRSTRAQGILVTARTVSDNVTLAQAVPVTFTPGLPDADRSTLTAAPATVAADGVSAATITVTLRDAYDNLTPGKAVTITTDGTAVSVTLDAAQTDAAGRVTGALRSTQAQTVTLRARDTTDGITLTQAAVVRFSSTDPQLSTVTAAPDTLEADGTTPATLTVTLRSTAGSPLAGKPVELQVTGGAYVNGQTTGALRLPIGSTGPGGTVTAHMTATTVGVKTIVAYGDDVRLNTPAYVTFTVGQVDADASQLQTDKTSLPADGAAYATLTAIANDRWGHPVAGKTVRLHAAGSSLTLQQPSLLTNAQGRVQATLRSTAVQTATVTAVDESDGITFTQSVVVRFVAGATDAAHSTVVMTPTTLSANGLHAAAITATLRDALDHPVGGRLVQLVATGSNNIISPTAQGTSDANGVIVFHLASTRAETKQVSVRDVNYNVTLTGGTLTFIPGAVSPSRSTLTASPSTAAADGASPITLTATLLDALGNPVPGVTVTLGITAPAGITLTQPAAPSNAYGRAQGRVVGTSRQPFTVTATAGAIRLDAQVVLSFSGPDLVVTKSGPTTGVAGRQMTYTLSVANASPAIAFDTVLTDTWPVTLTFVRQSGAYSFTQAGQLLVWRLGHLGAYQAVHLSVVGLISPTAPEGTTFVNRAEAATATLEDDTTDNADTTVTTIVPGYLFSVQLDPTQATAGVGGVASYQVRVRNTGNLPDQYSLALAGLNPAWYTLQPAALSLVPGQVGYAALTVSSNDCLTATTTYPFTLTVTSTGSGQAQPRAGQFSLSPQPLISELAPADGATLGATNALFSWKTSASSTGFVRLWPSGHITASQTHTATSGVVHSVNVSGLARNTDYEWYVHAESSCGVQDSAVRTLHIGNGLVFTQRSYNFTIQRDYGQQVSLAVHNQDVVSHTLLLTITTPPAGDLIVGFIGSGSADQRITLQPGQTQAATLALHAQDAQSSAYGLTAHLTADDAGGTPIRDAAPVNIIVHTPNVSFTLEQIGSDPVTLAGAFRLTNHGDPLTDLAVGVQVLSGTGTLYLAPGITHAKLDTGKKVEFEAYPALDAGFTGLTANLIASAAGVSRTLPVTVSLPAGTAVYSATLGDVALQVHNKDWYCSNRPDIHNFLRLPSGIRRANITSGKLLLSLRPYGAWHVLPHDLDAYVNENYVGGFRNLIPNGIYAYAVQPDYLNEAVYGPSVNDIHLKTMHMNGGHYVVASDIAMEICLREYHEWVVAESQEAANANLAARSYLLLPPSTLDVAILQPASGQTLIAGLPVTVTAQVSDDLTRTVNYVVTFQASGDNGGGWLYDDGQHGDGDPQDGVFGGTWVPAHSGAVTLTVQTGSCTMTGSDWVTATVKNLAYTANVVHSVPLTRVTVLPDTAAPGLAFSLFGADQAQLGWQQVLTMGHKTKTARFQARLSDMQPGEARQVASGTQVSYTGEGGAGQMALGPLYVAAPHIISIAPPTRTVGLGGSAVYYAGLYNPGPAGGAFTLGVAGLPGDWVSGLGAVWLPAGGYATLPITVTVPPDVAYPAEHAFAAVAQTAAGGQDQAGASLAVANLLDVRVEPKWAYGTGGQVVTYTVTVTNLEPAARTYALSAEGLSPNGVALPSTVHVDAGAAESVVLAVTIYADRGPHPFAVRAVPVGLPASRADDAVLIALGDRRVVGALSPSTARGGPGAPVLYHLTVTNTGSLTDTYGLTVNLPSGWSYRLEANGEPVSVLSLTPYVFNAAGLRLVVTPPLGAAARDYAFDVVVQSQHDPNVQATLTGTLTVTSYGVQVSITPEHTSLAPTDTGAWQVSVKNTGSMPDTYRLTAGGIVSESAQFAPGTLYLAPGETGSAALTAGGMDFALPQTYPFAVTARSQNEPAVWNYDTADITFTGYEAVDVEVVPVSQTLTNTLQTVYLVVITNTGNVDTFYDLSALADSLLAQLEVSAVYIPAHMAAGVLLTVRAGAGGVYSATVSAASASGTRDSDTARLVIAQSAVSGVVFEDVNGNATRDEGEPGLRGVTVSLDGAAAATTDAAGSYAFMVNTPGQHTVVESDPPGYLSTTPNTVTLEVELGHNYVTRFGDMKPADLSVVKTDAPDPVMAGAILTYTLVYTNDGPSKALAVYLTDTLPAGVVYGGVVTSSLFGPTQTGRLLTWYTPTLAAGVWGRLVFTVTVGAGAGGVSPSGIVWITNSVTITSTTFERDPADNRADEPTLVTAAPVTTTDLRVGKTDAPDPVMDGAVLTYTLVYTNGGLIEAREVYLTDLLPTQVTFGGVVEAVPPLNTPAQTGRLLTWYTPALAAGAWGRLVFTVTVNAGLGGAPPYSRWITNTAVITSTTPDADPGNNRAAQTTRVIGAPVICVPDEYEEDDAPAQAAGLASGVLATHNFCDDPSDWITFTAQANTIYTITTDASGQRADTILALYDADANTLLSLNDDYQGTTNLSSRLVWKAAADGVYFVQVTNRGQLIGFDTGYQAWIQQEGQTSHPLYLPLVVRAYGPPAVGAAWYDIAVGALSIARRLEFTTQLNSHLAPLGIITHTLPDAYEIDDTWPQAKPIAPGQVQTHTFDSPTDAFAPDKDYLHVRVTPGSTLTLTVQSRTGTTPTLELYTSTGDPYLEDGHWVTGSLTLAWFVPDRRDYYVAAFDAAARVPATYTLSMEGHLGREIYLPIVLRNF